MQSFVVPSEGRSGGLWLLWDSDIDLKVIRADSNIILASLVNNPTKEAFCLICMYGDPSHFRTKDLWKQISTFVDENNGKPMLCMGDLNEIMYPQDKSNANYVNQSRINLFCSLVKNCGLFDLGYNGPAYTWCNKRYSSKPLYERLDRFLANAEWSSLFPNANIYNLPILQGDHAPIMAVLHSKFKKPTYHFKFENWWLLEDDFQGTAKQAWEATHNYQFTARTRYLTGALKSWRKKKKPLQNQLNDIEEKIKEIQEKPFQEQDHNAEEKLTVAYEQTMTRLTEYYKQRAKKHWAIHGDKNTRNNTR